MPGVQYTLDNLPTFNSGTVDGNGVLWTASALDGWDSPDLREDVSDRPFRHGAFRGASYYGARPLTLKGTLIGPGDATTLRASRALLVRYTDLTVNDSSLVVAETPNKKCIVRRSGRLGLQQVGTHLLHFDLGLLAVDPRKYATSTTTISVPSSTPVTGTWAGDFNALPVVITLTPGAGSMTLADSVTGATFTVTTGAAVVIDSGADTVTSGGALAFARLTTGDPTQFVGQTSYSWTATGGTASIVYSAAWI